MKLLNRHKALLNVIRGLEEKGLKSRLAIVKTLFLLKKEYRADEHIKFYSFYPYKYGPFSQLCYDDLRKLKDAKLIDEEETSLTEVGKHISADSKEWFEAQLEDVTTRFKNEKEMTAYAYKRYPEFTVKSVLTNNKSIPKMGFCTIGYEGRDIDTFLNVLIQNGVDRVVDVRKNPFSMNFCYIKSKLQQFLKAVDIEYTHIPELGVESEERKHIHSKEEYELLFNKYQQALPQHESQLRQIVGLGKKHRIALLCMEHDAVSCHRREIAKYLREQGYEVMDL